MFGKKFTGATGQMAEIFSCLWPSECVVHRVTPNSDLSEYILDTEVYIEPDNASKPVGDWFTSNSMRFSKEATANLWTVAYASTSYGHI